MEEKQLGAFIQWLPTKIKGLQNKAPQEIVGILNEMSQSEEGTNTLTQLIDQFKRETSGAQSFRHGGWLGMPKNGGPGQVVPVLGNRKFQGGGPIPQDLNNRQANDNAEYKSALGSWNWNLNRAKKTILPDIGVGRRTLSRVYSTTGRSIDRIYAPGAVTDRDISPAGDTLFTLRLGRNDPRTFGPGHTQYKQYQQAWKNYGIY